MFWNEEEEEEEEWKVLQRIADKLVLKLVLLARIKVFRWEDLLELSGDFRTQRDLNQGLADVLLKVNGYVRDRLRARLVDARLNIQIIGVRFDNHVVHE